MDDLLDLARIDFAPLYQRARQVHDLAPGTKLTGDTVVTQGSGYYNAAKRREE